MKILKFGGTSLGSSHRIKNIIPLINYNDKKIVFLSAISGTTNHLERFVELINSKEYGHAKACLNDLKNKFIELGNGLFHKKDYLEICNDIINDHFSFIETYANENINVFQKKIIMAQGELITSSIVHHY